MSWFDNRWWRPESDQAAWQQFVDLYAPLLCSWTRRLALPPDDAADLVQDVLLLLVQKLPEFTYDPQKRFRGWLWTIMHNRWRDFRRKRAAEAQKQGLKDPLAEVAGPDELRALEEAEYRTYLVGRAMQLMQADFVPPTWKAFWECSVVARPAAEVAGELGMRIDAVYAAKSRVLRRLRRDLEGLLD